MCAKLGISVKRHVGLWIFLVNAPIDFICQPSQYTAYIQACIISKVCLFVDLRDNFPINFYNSNLISFK